jgi:hypothetical protein
MQANICAKFLILKPSKKLKNALVGLDCIWKKWIKG